MNYMGLLGFNLRQCKIRQEEAIFHSNMSLKDKLEQHTHILCQIVQNYQYYYNFMHNQSHQRLSSCLTFKLNKIILGNLSTS